MKKFEINDLDLFYGSFQALKGIHLEIGEKRSPLAFRSRAL